MRRHSSALAPALRREPGFDDGLLDEALRLFDISAGGEGAGLHGLVVGYPEAHARGSERVHSL